MLATTIIFFFISCIRAEDFLDKFHQQTYKIKDVRAEVASYNEEYFNRLDTKAFKFNRTTTALNISGNLKVDVKDKLEVLVQFYKLATNVYRVFPIRFQVSLVRIEAANVLGVREIYKCGNVKKMFFLKNISYYVCNYVIDDTKFPPLIPVGQYKVEINILYLENYIALLHAYGEIYIPFNH